MKEYKNIKQDTKDTPKTEKTKMKFVEAMKECMKSKSVDSITVRMITEKCGMTRQTFYRNFLDKYDLINWYFDRILLESFERMGDGKTIYEGLVKKFQYIEEEKLFFAVAFRSDDQNSLKQHDFELILEFYCNLIAEKNGEKPSSDIMFTPASDMEGISLSRASILISSLSEPAFVFISMVMYVLPVRSGV